LSIIVLEIEEFMSHQLMVDIRGARVTDLRTSNKNHQGDRLV